MSERIDCWNTIGVRGDQSCEHLADAGHCRHCSVYAGAAQRQRQQPLADAARVEWATVLAAPEPVKPHHDRSALSFRVGREWLALPAHCVAGVAPLGPAHRIPHRTGGALLGLVNVDGRLLPAVTLAHVLGLDDAPAAPSGRHVFARQLVFEWHGVTVALPVAEVDGLVRFAATDLQAAPTTANRAGALTGVLPMAGKHIGLLDPDRLAQDCARLLR